MRKKVHGCHSTAYSNITGGYRCYIQPNYLNQQKVLIIDHLSSYKFIFRKKLVISECALSAYIVFADFLLFL